MKNAVQKPIHRGTLRKFFGKEYYILKRRFNWFFSSKKWAQKRSDQLEEYTVFEHRSLILRPLKDVDMYLQENKRVNLSLAIPYLHKVTIGIGETFSIWKLVGRPTKSKGYLEGLVLDQGKVSKDIAGGLCQLGNLLFWIFAHSPLTIVERYRHGFDVFPDMNRNVPFGAGATLSYNHIDLQVRNDTGQPFQIELWLDETHLNGRLLTNNNLTSTYRIEERNHLMSKQYWGGYSRHNQIVQIETNEFGKEDEKLLVENHAILMYNPFIEESHN